MNSFNDKITKYPILQSVVDIVQFRGLSNSTCINYVDTIYRFLDFIHYDNSSKISVDSFREFLIHLNSTNLNKKTVNAYNSHIRFFFSAVLDQSINLNRVPKIKTTNKSIDFFHEHEVKTLLAASLPNSKVHCMIILGCCMGMRINEVASLRICDIHTTGINKYIHIHESKRNKSRNVGMDYTTYRAIQRYAKEYHITPGSDDFFFKTKNGNKYSTEDIRYHFNKYLKKAKLSSDLTFHSLRHTYAITYFYRSTDLLKLKYLMGHSSIATTAIYLHYAPEMVCQRSSYFDMLLKEFD